MGSAAAHVPHLHLHCHMLCRLSALLPHFIFQPPGRLALQLMITKPEVTELYAQPSVANASQVAFVLITILDGAVLLYNITEPFWPQVLFNIL